VKYRFSLVLLLGVGLCSLGAAQHSASVEATQRKLDHIESNGKREHPDSTPTMFSEQEINAYLTSGRVDLPAGVKSVRLAGVPGIVTANLKVDFDRLKAGQESLNPLLSVFSGIHDVVVEAHAHGAYGKGFVQVDSMSLDGVTIPRFVLELFIEKYLRPKYPEIGMESRFALPHRIDAAVVGLHILTIVQK